MYIIYNIYVHPPPPSFLLGWLNLLPNFQKWGAWNWDSFTENSVTFKKDKMGWRMKNFNILGVHWKIWVLRVGWGGVGGGGGFTKNQYIEEIAWKVGLGQFSDFRRGLARKGGGGGEWYPNAHCDIYLPIECFRLTYDLSGFKCRVNRHLLTVGSF